MRTLLLTGLTAAGLACGALGQGWFTLDSAGLTNGVVLNESGNRYNGVFGLEVWELNGTNTDLVDALNFAFVSVSGYGVLCTNGFHLEATYSGQTMSEGILALGTCRMPDVSPAAGTVTVALVAWNTSDGSLGAFLCNARVGARAGIIAFLQPTRDYTLWPLMPPPSLAWGVKQDLILYPAERPPAFASQPQDTTAVVGGTATFAVTVGSEWYYDYQWRFNGSEIPPAAYTSLVSTNAKFPQLKTYSLILTNVQPTNAGQYSFFVTNCVCDINGSVVSSNAVLTVTFPPPTLSIARADHGVTLSWPIWATNYGLQETMALSAPTTTWSNLPVSPVVGTNSVRVTLQPAASEKFYRLLK